MLILPQNVPRFAEVLTEIIASEFPSRSQFAFALGVSPSKITAYARGDYRPDERKARRMVALLKSEETKMRLMIAYIADLVPEEWRTKIKVTAK